MSYAAANILGATVLLFSIAYAWFLTGEFEQAPARYYPYAVLTFTAIVVTLWLVRSIKRRRSPVDGTDSLPRDSAQGNSAQGESALGSMGGYLVLAATLVYGSLVIFFGYVLPTLVYIALVAWFLGGRNLRVIGAVAVVFPFAIYFFLVYGFDRPLPF